MVSWGLVHVSPDASVYELVFRQQECRGLVAVVWWYQFPLLVVSCMHRDRDQLCAQSFQIYQIYPFAAQYFS